MSTEQEYQEHLFRGTALWQRGKRNEATHEFREAARLAPDNAEVQYNLGVALQEQGSEGEAVQCFQAVIKSGSSNNSLISAAHNNLGVALIRRRRLDEAIEQYRAAIRLDPANSRAHNSLGIALGHKRSLEEARHEFEIALQIDPNFKEAQHFLEVTLGELRKQRQPRGFWRRLFKA